MEEHQGEGGDDAQHHLDHGEDGGDQQGVQEVPDEGDVVDDGGVVLRRERIRDPLHRLRVDVRPLFEGGQQDERDGHQHDGRNDHHGCVSEQGAGRDGGLGGEEGGAGHVWVLSPSDPGSAPGSR
ncbi:hypothetical protein ACFFX0_03830 [Citricoccus parietis]|uniref:Uncharacterized protein n=1 Tax=Citricoccus parietis TaxID=592307 RepID=A0ABV5FUP6_9MICC